MTSRDRTDSHLDPDGPAAPPRRNGELVFEEPWESRLFGLTMSLHRAKVFEWEEFRRLLIDEVRRWEEEHPDGAGWSYYSCWRRAFERLLESKKLCTPADLEARVREIASRPPDH